MNSTESLVLTEAISAIKQIYGARLSKILLFGSYARGEQTLDSDLDLMVVLHDSQLSVAKEIRFINNSIFNLSLKHSIEISAHPVTASRFSSEPNFFFNRVKAEGIEL